MNIKTCRDCPSFVPAADADTAWSKSPNSDTCRRFGKILSRPDRSDTFNARIAESIGTPCAKHGEPLNVTDRAPVLVAQVAIGDPATFAPRASDAVLPASCAGCQHFVSPEIVRAEIGWPLAMCANKGRLLFSNRYVAEAADCGVGVSGQSRDTADGVIMLPEYEGTPVSVRPVVRAEEFDLDAEIKRHSIDPREYVTDRPVSDEDRLAQIVAWRKVLDPESQRPAVYLPVHNGTALCGFDPRDTYGSHRPDLYVDHQGLLYDAVVELYELDETPILIGGSGTGKTEFGCYLAYLMDLPFNRFSVTKATEEHYLLGEKSLIVDPATGQVVTSFQVARFARCYQLPGISMIDELNLNAAVAETIRPCTDSAKQLVIEADNGRVIKRGAYSFLMISQNPVDDPIYVGTEPLNAADMSRVSTIQFGLPSEEIERQIIKAHCADDDYDIDPLTLDHLMQIAADIRRQIADGSLPIAWGIRDQVKVARKSKFYSLEKAFRRAVVDGLPDDQVNVVIASVRSVTS